MSNVSYYEDVFSIEEVAITTPFPIEGYGYGIWAERSDLPDNSVEYVNKIREESNKKSLSDIISEVEESIG
ncbi:MAG: hypothetical protein AB1480_04470 [Nitrospirota bacterium]